MTDPDIPGWQFETRRRAERRRPRLFSRRAPEPANEAIDLERLRLIKRLTAYDAEVFRPDACRDAAEPE